MSVNAGFCPYGMDGGTIAWSHWVLSLAALIAQPLIIFIDEYIIKQVSFCLNGLV